MEEVVMIERNPVRIGLLLLTVALFLVLGMGVLGIGALTGCAEEKPATTVEELSREIIFTTDDGVILSGELFGSGKGGVVLAHAYPTDQTSWFPTAQELAAQGLLVLTFDCRGYGTSQGDKQIERIDRDVAAALHEIRSRGAESVALVGASMGGTAALLVAARESVDAVACLSAPVEFKGLSAREAVTKVAEPKLFLAAEKDEGVEGARELYGLAREPKELRLFPGGAHGTELLDMDGNKEAKEALLSFLTAHVPE